MKAKNRLQLVDGRKAFHQDVEIKNNKTGVLPANKNRPKRRPSLAGRIILFLLLFVIAFLFGSGLVKGLITRFMVRVVPVEYSVLEDCRSADFLVLRKETAVSVNVSGSFKRNYREGERVAKGAVIGVVTNDGGTSLEKEEKIAVTAPWAGMLSYQTDGYESICSPQVWQELNLDRFAELKVGLEPKDTGNAKDKDQVAAGELLCKIVDNLTPCYLFAEVSTATPLPGKNDSVDIELAAPAGIRVKAKIIDVIEKGTMKRVLFEIPCLKEVSQVRLLPGRLVVTSYKGVVVEQTALVEQNGKTGVYLLHKGIVTWQEASVAGLVDNLVCLEGLGTSGWLVASPGLVKEGQRIMFFND